MQRIGRYEVLDHLASGGMGHVYLARMTGVGGFERHVVVKALEVHDFEDDTLVTMFLDEARLLGALHHHFIAPVYEVGCDVDGRYFLVMDYVHGETVEAVLRASLERDTAVPLAFALTVVSSIASALDYAHALRTPDGQPLGIVHRDVSLSNIMIGYDGAVKLIDFGIAKAANRATKTQVGALKGKIGYLAPEQILHKHVDHRADIFALGIVLYELTTMTRAFRDTSDLNTLERITAGQIALPSQVVPGYPPELEQIVMKALSVDPARRFQDAGAMGRALEALAHMRGLQLGHATIAARMRELFDRARRRFARASSELKPQRALVQEPAAPIAVDDVATARMDLPPEIDPVTTQRLTPVPRRTPAPRMSPLAARDEPWVPEAQSAPVEVPPAPIPPAPIEVHHAAVGVRPVIVRFSTPTPVAALPRITPVTVTAEIVRPTFPASAGHPTLRRWLILGALIAVAVAVALAIALVG